MSRSVVWRSLLEEEVIAKCDFESCPSWPSIGPFLLNLKMLTAVKSMLSFQVSLDDFSPFSTPLVCLALCGREVRLTFVNAHKDWCQVYWGSDWSHWSEIRSSYLALGGRNESAWVFFLSFRMQLKKQFTQKWKSAIVCFPFAFCKPLLVLDTKEMWVLETSSH